MEMPTFPVFIMREDDADCLWQLEDEDDAILTLEEFHDMFVGRPLRGWDAEARLLKPVTLPKPQHLSGFRFELSLAIPDPPALLAAIQEYGFLNAVFLFPQRDESVVAYYARVEQAIGSYTRKAKHKS